MDIIGSENVLIHFSYKWVLNSFLSTLVFLSLDIHSHKMNIEIQSPLYYYNQMEHANYYYIVCDMYFNTFHFAKLHCMLLHLEKPVKDTIFLIENYVFVIYGDVSFLSLRCKISFIFIRIQPNFHENLIVFHIFYTIYEFKCNKMCGIAFFGNGQFCNNIF